MVAELPETNRPIELWDGELVMSPSPRPSHQQLVLNLATRLKRYVARKKLGQVFVSPLDVILSPRRVVQPDVLFIARERLAIVQDAIRGAPDLVAEVVSEGSWRRDRVDKRGLYEQFGVSEYWILDPEAQTIEVLVLEKGAYRLHARADADQPVSSQMLPDFQISWADLTG